MNDEQTAQLIEVMHKQAAAITRLADSNAALVSAMAEGDDSDMSDESVPGAYLDGSPA